jgi:hypothetical protein
MVSPLKALAAVLLLSAPAAGKPAPKADGAGPWANSLRARAGGSLDGLSGKRFMPRGTDGQINPHNGTDGHITVHEVASEGGGHVPDFACPVTGLGTGVVVSGLTAFGVGRLTHSRLIGWPTGVVAGIVSGFAADYGCVKIVEAVERDRREAGAGVPREG